MQPEQPWWKSMWVQVVAGTALVGFALAMLLVAVRVLRTEDEATPPGSGAPRSIGLAFDDQGHAQVAGIREPLETLEEIRFHLATRARERDPKQIAVVISGPTGLPFKRVYETLVLCRAAGFETYLIEANGNEGVPVALPRRSRTPRINPVDPNKVTDEDLELPSELSIIVKSTPDGTVAALIVQSFDGEVAMAGFSTLARYLKTRQADAPRTDLTIAAEARLSIAAVHEAVRTCRQAGFTRVSLAAPPDLAP